MNVVFFGLNNIVLRTIEDLLIEQFTFTIVTNDTQFNQYKANELLINNSSTVKLKIVQSSVELNEINIDKETHNFLLISVGAPWIIKRTFIESAKNQIFNLHGTHLPKERGGNIFSWLILNERKVGICAVHRLTPELDTGEIIAWSEFLYSASCRLPKDYITYYEEKNISFLKKFIADYFDNKYPVNDSNTQQPEYLSTYLPRLRADVNGWIDWSWPCRELENFICAFDEPYGGAHTEWRGKIVILRDAYSQKTEGYTHPFQHGIVIRKNPEWIVISACGGELLITSITDETGADIYPAVKIGDRFATNPSRLYDARKRIIKTSKGLEVQSDFPG
jgi:methionyl-tRNA formyltransferase